MEASNTEGTDKFQLIDVKDIRGQTTLQMIP